MLKKGFDTKKSSDNEWVSSLHFPGASVLRYSPLLPSRCEKGGFVDIPKYIAAIHGSYMIMMGGVASVAVVNGKVALAAFPCTFCQTASVYDVGRGLGDISRSLSHKNVHRPPKRGQSWQRIH